MNKKGSTPTFDLEKVKLYVSGPRSLIRTAKTATASLTETWAEYLHREFEISVREILYILQSSLIIIDNNCFKLVFKYTCSYQLNNYFYFVMYRLKILPALLFAALPGKMVVPGKRMSARR